MLTYWVLCLFTHHHQELLKAVHGGSWEEEGCEESLGHCQMCYELHWSEESTLLNMVYGAVHFTPSFQSLPTGLMTHH